MVLRKTECLLCYRRTGRLFCLPKDMNRMKTWLKKIGQEVLLDMHNASYLNNNGRLCSAHFDEDAFSSTEKKHLIKFAEPMSVSSQYPLHDVSSSVTNTFQPVGVTEKTKLIKIADPISVSSQYPLHDVSSSVTNTFQPVGVTEKTKQIKIAEPISVSSQYPLHDVASSVTNTFQPVGITEQTKLIKIAELISVSSQYPLHDVSRSVTNTFQPVGITEKTKLIKFSEPNSVSSHYPLHDVSSSVTNTFQPVGMSDTTQVTALNTDSSIFKSIPIPKVIRKTQCLLCNCIGKPMFCFPKDLNRLKLWLKRINQEELLDMHDPSYVHNNGRLCSAHFDDAAFSSTEKTKLIKFANPICISSHFSLHYVSSSVKSTS